MIKPVKTKAEHEKALRRVYNLMQKETSAEELDEMEVLSILIEAYEKEHYPIGSPRPLEAIKYRMEQLGMKKADLAQILGQKSRVSEIFSGKRQLTLKMIKALHKELGIPVETLLAD